MGNYEPYINNIAKSIYISVRDILSNWKHFHIILRCLCYKTQWKLHGNDAQLAVVHILFYKTTSNYISINKNTYLSTW